MQKLLFPMHTVTLPIMGATGSHLEERFPIRRVYCVGQNYAEHVKEMGVAKDKMDTFFFDKPADAVVEGPTIRYPTETKNFHHEVELVVAICKPGRKVTSAQAADMIFGYAVGLDMTRRDMQRKAKDMGRPWDLAKGFDESAPCSAIKPMPGVVLRDGRIELLVNGSPRQSANLEKMLVPVDELISMLSQFVDLLPGDLIFTGTPEGVGMVQSGDSMRATIERVGSLDITVVPAEPSPHSRDQQQQHASKL